MRAPWEIFCRWFVAQSAVDLEGDPPNKYERPLRVTIDKGTPYEVPRWLLGAVGANEDEVPQAQVDYDRAVKGIVGTALFTGWQDYGAVTANATLTVTIVAGGDSASDPCGRLMPLSYRRLERVGEIVHGFGEMATWTPNGGEEIPDDWPRPEDIAAAVDHEDLMKYRKWRMDIIEGGEESIYADDDNYYLEITFQLLLKKL